MQMGFIKQILKRPADIPELTFKKSKTNFETLGYICLSGWNRILKFKNFPDKTHPNILHTHLDFSHADLAHAQFSQSKKTHQPRTCCISKLVETPCSSYHVPKSDTFFISLDLHLSSYSKNVDWSRKPLINIKTKI